MSASCLKLTYHVCFGKWKSKISYHTVFEFSVKEGLALMKIYNKLVNMVGNAATSKTMVCKCAFEYKCGHTSIKDEPAVDT